MDKVATEGIASTGNGNFLAISAVTVPSARMTGLDGRGGAATVCMYLCVFIYVSLHE